MKLNKDYPVYVFDTSALIDFAIERTSNHSDLLDVLDQNGQYFYHPVTLAELADYTHEKIWRDRKPSCTSSQIKQGIRIRNLLIFNLYQHCKSDNPSTYLYYRRFLPFHVTFDLFSLTAHQRRDSKNLCRINGKCTAVANMTDHHILAVASFINRIRKYEVKFVSGDKAQLAAANHLKIPWIYSKIPACRTPFTWNNC